MPAIYVEMRVPLEPSWGMATRKASSSSQAWFASFLLPIGFVKT